MPKHKEPNHFTLVNGQIVSDAYARKRVMASLRKRWYIPLEHRRALVDYVINSGWYRGLLVEALTRSAANLYYHGYYNEDTKQVER
jgi:hypothetical protein